MDVLLQNMNDIYDAEKIVIFNEDYKLIGEYDINKFFTNMNSCDYAALFFVSTILSLCCLTLCCKSNPKQEYILVNEKK